MNSDLRQLLLSLADLDRSTRSELAKDGSLFDGYHPRMQAVHEQNAAQLQSALGAHGWPGASLVGEDGAEAAWLIAQHAIGLPQFQRDCLTHLEAAASRGDVPAWQPAYLLDRIRYFEGKPQVYGTQFDPDENGVPQPYPIESPESVNERRTQIGLDTIEERQQKMAASSKEERPFVPTDPEVRAARQRQYESWLRSTGWRS